MLFVCGAGEDDLVLDLGGGEQGVRSDKVEESACLYVFLQAGGEGSAETGGGIWVELDDDAGGDCFADCEHGLVGVGEDCVAVGGVGAGWVEGRNGWTRGLDGAGRMDMEKRK